MEWMALALDYARRAGERGEVPVGAVITYEGRLVAGSHNMSQKWKNPLAHAEMLALVQAHKKLKTYDLSQCDLYVTLEPCPLCKCAIRMSHIRHTYFGAYAPAGPWKEKDSCFMGGFHELSCEGMLKDFFSQMRHENSENHPDAEKALLDSSSEKHLV